MSFIGAFFCFLGKIGTGRMFSFGVDAFFPRWAEGTEQNATLMPESGFFYVFGIVRKTGKTCRATPAQIKSLKRRWA